MRLSKNSLLHLGGMTSLSFISSTSYSCHLLNFAWISLLFQEEQWIFKGCFYLSRGNKVQLIQNAIFLWSFVLLFLNSKLYSSYALICLNTIAGTINRVAGRQGLAVLLETKTSTWALLVRLLTYWPPLDSCAFCFSRTYHICVGYCVCLLRHYYSLSECSHRGRSSGSIRHCSYKVQRFKCRDQLWDEPLWRGSHLQ